VGEVASAFAALVDAEGGGHGRPVVEHPRALQNVVSPSSSVLHLNLAMIRRSALATRPGRCQAVGTLQTAGIRRKITLHARALGTLAR